LPLRSLRASTSFVVEFAPKGPAMVISFIDGRVAPRTGKSLSVELIWRKRRVSPI
jgi:hypothetical protein